MGRGTLSITDGGSVVVNSTRAASYLGSYANSSGLISVEGVGSIWTNVSSLALGQIGQGTISIAGGGVVTAGSVLIGNSQSLLSIDVGRNSQFTVSGGTGTLVNDGIVRIVAGAGVPTDGVQYSPISAGAWSGTGTYQAVGGTWNATGHTFTASSVTKGTSGAPVALDLASVQRTLIDDSGTGWEVGASFLAKPTSTALNFTATAMNSGTLNSLQGLLAPGQSVLSGWNFSADAGYTPGDPIYFSFKVGSGYSTDDLDLWSYNGTSWAAYVPTDLTYDGTFASFTATGLSGYAVTTVPEPSVLVLLGIGAISLLAFACRRQRKLHNLPSMILAAMMVLAAGSAQADVFNMGGTLDPTTGTWTGQASLEFVTVGDPGNAADTSNGGHGSVPYVYQMGKYDVTVGQYVQFLNAVAKTDTYGLYNSYMAVTPGYPPWITGSMPTVGITQGGSPGSYSYAVTGSYAQAANCPIFDVTWGDAARFCNWLQNGQLTSGVENASTTENGAYTLNGATSQSAVMGINRNLGATYVIPTENEWYKAAYYDLTLNGGTGGYWTYPTKSNTAPSNILSSTGTNNANFYNGGYTDPTNLLTPVGAFAASPGPYGSFDMGGDVWQWNEAAVATTRGLRGGYWDDSYSGLASSGGSYYSNPSYEYYFMGFRVASVPEPGSIALAVMGGLCLLAFAWRRRRV